MKEMVVAEARVLLELHLAGGHIRDAAWGYLRERLAELDRAQEQKP